VSWKRPRLVVNYRDKENKIQSRDARLKPPGKEWERLSFARDIPADATEIFVLMSASQIVANVYFDNFKVEIVPSEK